MRHVPYGPYERWVKRLLDCVLAVLALIVLSPLIAAVAFLVRLRLGSPVLFRQERPGKDEKTFTLYKFRSMTNAYDSAGRPLSDDERLTPFGRWLRATSLDELPELLNVAKGDMALIGPRPLLMAYLPCYTPEERHRHDVRPGISGLAQTEGRNMISWEQKFLLDLQYVQKITWWGDVKIIIKTVIKTIQRADIAVGKDHQAGRLDVARAGQERLYGHIEERQGAAAPD